MTAMALIGEAWGEQEARERTAFVGYTGQFLNQVLVEVGIRRSECFLTNVFNLRPEGNKIDKLCGPKDIGLPGYPPLGKAGYVRREFTNELVRLGKELDYVKPNIIVALGNTASWALLGKTMITRTRGVIQLSTLTAPGFKTISTYHPSAVTRQWTLRPVMVLDMYKAKRESDFPDIRRPKRQIWIAPTVEDILEYDKRYIQQSTNLSVDIETVGSIITCIGFAPNKSTAIVIPFVDNARKGRTYWPSVEVECRVWTIVREILGRPVPKTFQNGLYDIAFLWRRYGIRTYGAEHDTMLLHHALQPESLKSLGFLGSVYTNEGAWKQMRKVETIKRED